MELQSLLRTDYLDIVFDHRNKNYGSYELRRHYTQRMRNAAILTGIAIVVLCTYSLYGNKDMATQKVFTITRPQTISDLSGLQMPHIQPKSIGSAQIKVKATAFDISRIVQDHDVQPDKLVQPVKELSKVTIEPSTVGEGVTSPDGISGNSNGTGIGKGINSGAGSTSMPKDNKPFTYVSQMPEFSGDINEYLSTHLQYPQVARESNIAGRVLVSFVVNEDGSISNAKIERGIGGGCNEEALRVINSMPHWKPGRQNGVAVKVLYTLPIVFVLQ